MQAAADDVGTAAAGGDVGAASLEVTRGVLLWLQLLWLRLHVLWLLVVDSHAVSNCAAPV